MGRRCGHRDLKQCSETFVPRVLCPMPGSHFSPRLPPEAAPSPTGKRQMAPPPALLATRVQAIAPRSRLWTVEFPIPYPYPSAESEAGIMPDDATLMTRMATFHEEMAKAGALLDASGLKPSSLG